MLHSSADIAAFSVSILNDALLELVPELPRPQQRWTARRKAQVVEAVRGGWVPIEEVCERYNISVDEFLAWERDVDRYGVPGLRATRFQIYRDTDKDRQQRFCRVM
jgi:hypothetical protein